MILRKIPHYTDRVVTTERAKSDLGDELLAVTQFSNHENVHCMAHSHPFYELILPLKGSTVRYSAEGTLYDLHVGEFIIFPAGVYHAGVFNISGSSSDRLVVQINGDLWQRAMASSGAVPGAWDRNVLILKTDAVVDLDLRGLFERMAQAIHMPDKAQATILFCEVTELILLIDYAVSRAQMTEPTATSQLTARATAYIENNYTDPALTVTQVAQYAYTSREHLSRVFKDYTLESVHSYITNLRMEHFCRAIADGMSVLDACTASGFSDYSSFLKTFRRMYGITPSAYRARLFGEDGETDA